MLKITRALTPTLSLIFGLICFLVSLPSHADAPNWDYLEGGYAHQTDTGFSAHGPSATFAWALGDNFSFLADYTHLLASTGNQDQYDAGVVVHGQVQPDQDLALVLLWRGQELNPIGGERVKQNGYAGGLVYKVQANNWLQVQTGFLHDKNQSNQSNDNRILIGLLFSVTDSLGFSVSLQHLNVGGNQWFGGIRYSFGTDDSQ